jgi:hypothetical protein
VSRYPIDDLPAHNQCVHQLLLICFETRQAFIQRLLNNRSCIVIRSLPGMNADQRRYLLTPLASTNTTVDDMTACLK